MQLSAIGSESVSQFRQQQQQHPLPSQQQSATTGLSSPVNSLAIPGLSKWNVRLLYSLIIMYLD